MPFLTVIRPSCAVLLAMSASAVFAATQPTLIVISGNGQLVRSQFLSAGMVVQVNDPNGNPIPNAAVNWTVSSGLGTVGLTLTYTGSNGQTGNNFVAPDLLIPQQTFLQTTITASYPDALSVDFIETAYYVNLANSVPSVEAYVTSPAIGQVLTGGVGSQSSVPVQVQVIGVSGSQTNIGVPNVSVTIAPADSTNPATVACSTAVLTDQNGNATCNVVFGGTPGSGAFTINVGDFSYGLFSQDLNYQVTVGLPAIVRVVSGDMQSGNSGEALSAPLVAEVTDAAGNPLQGVPVVFTSVTPGAATITVSQGTSDQNGQVRANVTLGNIVGPLQVQVSTAAGVATVNGQPATVLFNLTGNLVLSGLQKVSGDTQTAQIGTAFASPVTVQVTDANGAAVQGVPVTFAITGGDATLGATSATTDAQGQASATVTAGQTPGTVTVTASSGGFSAAFNLTVLANGPACTPDSFANGASFQVGKLAPGGIAVISCTGLATGVQGVIVPTLFGPLPLQIAGVTVKFGTSSAPLYYVANLNGAESVALQIPFEVVPGPAVPVTIGVSGGGTATVNVAVAAVSPGLFGTTMSDGKVRAVLVRPDGSFVSLQNPAHRGETIRMFATGLGTVTPAVATGGLAPEGTLANTVLPVIVGVNNAGVQVISATYAQDLIGVYEVDFAVPNDVPSGNDIPLAIAVESGSTLIFGNGSSIPIQ